MIGQFFGHNLEIRPISEAVVSLDDIYYTYGYGVYETLKVRKGSLYFAEEHVHRLFESARILSIGHQFEPSGAEIVEHLKALILQNAISDCNIKILMIGTHTNFANLYVLPLAPLFPNRDLYKKGVSAVTFEGERAFPNAKSLNMLMSAIAFKKATENKAYDALLLDSSGKLREGTRTNVFYVKDGGLWTPPDEEVLLGVTRSSIISCFEGSKWQIGFAPLKLDEIKSGSIKSVFLSSTSTKLIPVREIDGIPLIVDENSEEIVAKYSHWLKTYAESLQVLIK